MRGLAEPERIKRFMRALGAASGGDAHVFFTGGVSAVLMGWRRSTIDVDLSIVPDRDEVLRLLPALKEQLEINIELASPAQFLPELPGWQDRSPFIAREGRVSFHHYDFYSQALAKIERDHPMDRVDVHEMLARGLVEPMKLRDLFEAIVPRLYRYPAVDPAALRRAVDRALAEEGS